MITRHANQGDFFLHCDQRTKEWSIRKLALKKWQPQLLAPGTLFSPDPCQFGSPWQPQSRYQTLRHLFHCQRKTRASTTRLASGNSRSAASVSFLFSEYDIPLFALTKAGNLRSLGSGGFSFHSSSTFHGEGGGVMWAIHDNSLGIIVMEASLLDWKLSEARCRMLTDCFRSPST